MAKRRKAKTTTVDADGLWESLTWDDLSAWAGERSVQRGRTYQRQGRVENLVQSEDARLLASVRGQQEYVTSVWCRVESPREHPIQSTCTCPVGYDGRKHAVAVVAEYLAHLADGEDVPAADPDDSRWLELDGEDDDSEDSYESDWFDGYTRKKKRSTSKTSGQSREKWDHKIAEHIRAKGRQELADLVISLTDRFPELWQEFQERISLGEGDVDRLVKEARRQMEEQTSEPGWRDSWAGEGFTPNFTAFRRRLERLVEMGHADAVVELGREFIRRGMDQIGQSSDEGETGMAFAECLPVVFTAVTQSGLSGSEQLLYAIDAHLEDDYGFIDSVTDPILDGDWTPADWSEVAECLKGRLDGQSDDDEESRSPFRAKYHRNCLSRWLLSALENAGRGDELRQVYEAEARATGSYERFVRYLLDQGEIDEACRWAEEGIEQTREPWPGIAQKLKNCLREIARDRKQWDVVAAHAAEEFFEGPSEQSYENLIKAARKAKCLKKVKSAALQFLETGELPFRQTPQRKAKRRSSRIVALPEWPLPVPKYLSSLWVKREVCPHYDVLLDLAIAAKKPDEILHWYGTFSDGRKSPGRSSRAYFFDDTADRVADAVAKSHPLAALEIYTGGLNANLEPANPSAYERAAGYLKKMRPILKSLGRETEWTDLIEQLRLEYKRRRLFMEALDRVDGQTIVQTRKKQRQR